MNSSQKIRAGKRKRVSMYGSLVPTPDDRPHFKDKSKMHKFRTWLSNLISPLDNRVTDCVEVDSDDHQRRLSIFDDGNALNLVIVPGEDGLIIESRVYNDHTGEWIKKVHMVYGDDLHENLGAKLRDIVFLHSIRR